MRTLESGRAVSLTSGARQKPIALTTTPNRKRAPSPRPSRRRQRLKRDGAAEVAEGISILILPYPASPSLLLERNHAIRSDLAVECVWVRGVLRAGGRAGLHPDGERRRRAR